MTKNVSATAYAMTAVGTGGTYNSWQPTGGAQAWSYIGIPYITDDVPAAIMPTLPTAANMRSGWGYDPTQIANPTFTEASNQYYVDKATGNDGTAGNGGRGTVALPRETIPGISGNVWTLAVDDQLFLVGDGNEYIVIGTDLRDVIFPGTASQKVWVIGVGTTRPIITVDRFWFSNSSHVIMDNIDFKAVDGILRIRTSEGTSATTGDHHMCFRHCRMYGNGVVQTASTNMAVMLKGYDINNTSEFFCVYDCDIFDFGQWDYGLVESTDYSAITAKRYGRYFWIIENRCYHMQGDSFIPEGATWTSGTDFDDPSARMHYAYCAGNEFYENYEQAIDCKNSFHVIISENDIHDFFTAPKTANSTAIILSNNTEGDHTSFHWALFNEITNNGANRNATGTTGIRDSGSEDGEINYAIGNRISYCETSMQVGNTNTNRESYFVDNSCYNADVQGFRTNQGNASAILRLHGNIFEDCTQVTLDDTFSSAQLTDNVLFNTTDSDTWDVDTGNVTGDPNFTDPANGDFNILTGSSAIDISDEDAVYQDFEDLYGIDITVDASSTDRPASIWDAGALEKV